MSPKPIQACRSFPNIALFQTHTRTKSNEKQIKLNKFTKRTKSEQHRQYQSAAVFHKEVCIYTIRCFSAMICLCLNFVSNSAFIYSFWGDAQSKCVWWCTSLPGAQVSQWTGSFSGWVNEASPQEDVSVHLCLLYLHYQAKVGTATTQMLVVTCGCGCMVKCILITNPMHKHFLACRLHSTGGWSS